MLKQTKYLTNQKKTNKQKNRTNQFVFWSKNKQKLKQGTTAEDSENKLYTESNKAPLRALLVILLARLST